MSDSRTPDSQKLSYEELSALVKKQATVIANQQARTKSILYGIPLGLLVIDKQQRIEAVNKLVQDHFEYKPDELKGERATLLFPELQKFEPNSKPVVVVARRKSGETFPAEISVNEFDANLDFVHIQDITERHRLEKLRQDFLAMVSHDLRTPLTSIRLFLQMAAMGNYGDMTDKGKRAIDRAESSTELLISIVNDLLEAEKIESGDLEIDLTQTTTSRTVERAIGASQGAAKAGEIRLEHAVTNDVFLADEERIVQVLINLITNAIKYSPADSVVTVLAGLEGARVVFRVRDQGVGVPKHLQTAIFERYRQLDQPKDTKKRGVGLGLAICKRLVEKHHGSIWVESEEGKGSTFCVAIPLADNV
ncbi:MAG: ATP-binding protein [Candidatus Melainabacteria bacterium]|nr:ATP-binding protein [Candidatus Melainabacteria bacterium]